MIGFLRRLFGLPTRPPAPSVPTQPGRHDMPVQDMVAGNEDIISGWRYCATLQLRTPLVVLKEHGRFAPLAPGGPPQLSPDMWHGIWMPVLRDPLFDVFDNTMSSDVGQIPVDGGDYLTFLLTLRTITEGGMPIKGKEAALRGLVKETGPKGTPYAKFHKVTALVDQVLPRSITLLPVARPAQAGLLDAGLTTLAKVEKASDKELLAIKGLGPKGVKAIREFLASTTADKHATRVVADLYRAP
ncbi:helix-hairpin-helix domain-containing protein [Pseudoxanthomonas winnipegensis]|uniref:helix-hairpin-helix domain-containing protein n=1 Tax=Pseudoxanthomonas winnipegensis TaxID=2480810 RepID=UPI00103D860B|nr:helix-hairpin-helix domain-containing protein [Pseudoxanthomonas winnipegensis]TBV69763.1 helix-hairpin-helix domain-containing protein [Pseudoxanthomonas winnipegensis]